MSLYMAAVWGLPMQIFVCLMGISVSMLSITGVIVWLRKRRARVVKQSTNTQAQPISHVMESVRSSK
jgi:uncharacterized iron-regulated membrane protein